ncbi:MAG: hypothetical protein K2O18_00940 [Oscillospiraceae bacterium]|nr:hypothetical protein [Oscillospiraceae bacterium]
MNAFDLGEKIEKVFKRFNVNVELTDWTENNNRVRYDIKLRRNTTEEKLRAYAPDVQNRLKLPLFQVVTEDFDIYLVVSKHEAEYPRLPAILEDNVYREEVRKKKLPYFVGHNAMGKLVHVDLATLPHLLLGGASNSGKSVGLQAMIVSTAYTKRPSEVNLILIDVGAGDLMVFDGIPHLSCPVVRNCDAAYHTLMAVKDEMERRIDLEHTKPDDYRHLPRLVLVIDEFPALFTGQSSKEMSRAIAVAISSLLQRGRHAKIHLVLAAQNPTYQNMKIDLGNITARIAFRCARKNFSETILGEGGAENLLSSGSLLLKSPHSSGTEWIQGIYIKPRELRQLIQEMRELWMILPPKEFVITIPDSDSLSPPDTLESQLTCAVVRKGPSKVDQLLADLIMWTLEQKSISINSLMIRYHFGWNRASTMVKRLEELGIVGRPEGKAPREVIPDYPEDLPEELIGFLQNAGYSQDSVIDAFCNRTERPANG